jgi:acyl-CoA reductase-like NAD-dependent aldehyde dehydrogenase
VITRKAAARDLSGVLVVRDEQAVAAEIAVRLEAGTVWVNEIHIHGVTIPFGGRKCSL